MYRYEVEILLESQLPHPRRSHRDQTNPQEVEDFCFLWLQHIPINKKTRELYKIRKMIIVCHRKRIVRVLRL